MNALISKDNFLLARDYIYKDIKRELELASASSDPAKAATLQSLGVTPGGGNFLAALALLCYTEFGGTLVTGQNINKSRHSFDTFLRTMGPGYVVLLDSGLNVYNLFRCGMAHEYFVKQAIQVSVFGVPPTGLGKLPDGRLFFCLQKYFEDFIAAYGSLGKQLGYL